MKEKHKVFGKCEKCIGITPCKILSDGRIVCEYCTNEVEHFNFKSVAKVTKNSMNEQSLET